MSELREARDARRRRASRFGRLGGTASAAERKGDAQWGRMMVCKRRGKARARHYPMLCKLWARRAAAIRWNRVRAREGRPLLDVPEVPLVMTPRAIAMREQRALERRRRAYDQVAAPPQLSCLQTFAEIGRGYRAPALRGSA